MPEGPEVKTITDQLRRILVGSILKDVQVISGPHQDFAEKIEEYLKPAVKGKNNLVKISNVKCKGKFIYIEVILYKKENNEFIPKSIRYIGNHLGMTGHWRRDPGDHTMVELKYTETNDSEKIHTLYFDDMRHFGKFSWLSKSELAQKLKELGPDVLSDFTEEIFDKIIGAKSIQNKMIGIIL